jgi:methionine-gamma-lyase
MHTNTIPQNHVQTLAIHAGEHPDPQTGASAPNIVMSTSFVADPDTSFSVEGMDESTPFFYSRWKNPTVQQLEQKLAALEQAEQCIAFGSGMAAISALFFHCLAPGDHLIMSDVAYAAAAEITNDLIPRLGINVTKVNMSDLDAVRAAVTPRTKLLYTETICNPILRLSDIEALAVIAKNIGAKLAVDSTFTTPLAVRPISLGADYVIHSLSKYLCGHGDAIGGALLGATEDLAVLKKTVAIRTGGILSPFNAWLILRGIATLPLRMRAHQENAIIVARFLEQHPNVQRVVYPGLPSHPQYELATRMLKNTSGMLTFQVKDETNPGRIFYEQLDMIHYAVSLGHHRSLIFYLRSEELYQSSYPLTESQKLDFERFAGNGFFRLSVGLENPEDICADLEHALSSLA